VLGLEKRKSAKGRERKSPERTAKQNRKHIEDNEANFCALALPPVAGESRKVDQENLNSST